MPQSKFILCGAVCSLIVIAATSQSLPKHPTIQQVVGFQQYQQQKWNMKQLPANSVLYKHYSNSIELPFENSFKPIQSKEIFLPAVNLYSSPGQTDLSYDFSLHFSHLQSYLQQKRSQNYQWQKQSWWRDPSKGTGALLIKDIFLNKQGFIHQ